jgi:hypothetical protein
MEKKKNIFSIIIISLILLSGCATPRISDSDIVLIDSEIPWKMSVGEYKSYDGRVFSVNEEHPRWSVSEAWVFDAFTSQEKRNGSYMKIMAGIIAVTCFIILTLVGIKFFK